MSCNECNKNKTTYTYCEDKPNFCGCPYHLDARCIDYYSSDLKPLGVKKGDNLDRILKIINGKIEHIYYRIEEDGLNITSSGEGIQLFTENIRDNVTSFKTLKAGEGIMITESLSGIEVKIDENWLNNKILKLIE